MKGAIIGDIVGSRFEFDNVRSDDFELFGNGCDYTDDTICTIAIADAILSGSSYEQSIRDWCGKYPHPKGGYGGGFRVWLDSPHPKPYNSYGNGSAMRVSPVGFLFGDPNIISNEAKKSAECTHNHKEGIKGAVVVANAIYLLRNRVGLDKVNEYVGSHYSLPQYKPFSNPFDETCMNAVPVSFSCFFASHSFEDAIRKAMIVGGDSDTIGAITGSLAEAHYGVPDHLWREACSYLPKDMLEVITKAYERL